MHVSETPASRNLHDVKLIGKKFRIFILSHATWQRYLWSMMGKMGEKKQCKTFQKAIQLSCGYTPPANSHTL